MFEEYDVKKQEIRELLTCSFTEEEKLEYEKFCKYMRCFKNEESLCDDAFRQIIKNY